MNKKNNNFLTNEHLNKEFDSPFNLVNFAIKQARNKIARGDLYGSNLVTEVLLDLEYSLNMRNVDDCEHMDDEDN